MEWSLNSTLAAPSDPPEHILQPGDGPMCSRMSLNSRTAEDSIPTFGEYTRAALGSGDEEGGTPRSSSDEEQLLD